MTPFETARDATKALHDGMASELPDESLESYRDLVSNTWPSLSEVERRRINGLSADLYMFSENEDSDPVFADVSHLEIVTRLFGALERPDSDEALTLLRAASLEFSPELRAYVRSRCWTALGDKTIAKWFSDFAERIHSSTDLEKKLRAQRLPSRSTLRASQAFGRPGTRSSHGLSAS